jgi:hypothetical protein
MNCQAGGDSIQAPSSKFGYLIWIVDWMIRWFISLLTARRECTTAARKGRTVCGCQPVERVTVAMVGAVRSAEQC